MYNTMYSTIVQCSTYCTTKIALPSNKRRITMPLFGIGFDSDSKHSIQQKTTPQRTTRYNPHKDGLNRIERACRKSQGPGEHWRSWELREKDVTHVIPATIRVLYTTLQTHCIGGLFFSLNLLLSTELLSNSLQIYGNTY